MSTSLPAPKKRSSMLINILIGFIVFVALLSIVVLTRSSDLVVTRSISINAPPDIAFAHVNELQRWQQWSPWEKLDPSMERILEGPPSGVGAIYRWDGNEQVGAGSNTVIESRPNEFIRFRLDILRPVVSSNDVLFTFQPEGDATKVTWTMKGKLNFVAKIMDLIIGMDKMIGSQFESGLNQLKKMVEADITE